ncbi:MAG: ABC transporter permease [Betaproteobacteria bacterium]|nr:ABC transporter permease [Betaproteobacteria bacterium]
MAPRPAHSWRWLLANFLKREVSSRYTGSVGGIFWALANPLVQLALYAFVFGVLLRAPADSLGGWRFPAFLAIALWPWLMFGDSVKRAMDCIPANTSLIRKVAFPHELLIVAAVGGTFFIHLLGWAAVLVALRLWGEPVSFAGLLLALPLLVAQFAFTLGVGAFLAALQVVLRDVEQAVGLALTVVFYATPIVYPLALIPAPYRDWLALNPLAYVVTRYRDLLSGAGGWQAGDLGVIVASLLTLAAGLWVFRRLSPWFEDLL